MFNSRTNYYSEVSTIPRNVMLSIFRAGEKLIESHSLSQKFAFADS